MGMREWDGEKWVHKSGGIGTGGSTGEIPSKLPNPYPLTINGQRYDGSEAVAVEVTGGSGIHIGPDAPTDENVDVWIDTDEDEGSTAQPDWNAAEGEAGHVLNRTHYSEFTEMVLLEESSVEFTEETEGMLILNGSFTIGDTYKVTWNGVEYSGEIVLYEGMAVGGNLSCFGDASTEYTEPFCLACMDGVAVMITSFGAMPLTVTASVTVITETVHKLPRKYIDTNTYIITDVTLSGDVYTVNESYDSFAPILYRGGQVWVKFDTDDMVVRALICYFTLNSAGMIMQGYLNGEPKIFNATNGTWTPSGT